MRGYITDSGCEVEAGSQIADRALNRVVLHPDPRVATITDAPDEEPRAGDTGGGARESKPRPDRHCETKLLQL